MYTVNKNKLTCFLAIKSDKVNQCVIQNALAHVLQPGYILCRPIILV